jgi:hypothetical protein
MQISFVEPSRAAAGGGAWVVGAVEGGALLPAAVRWDKACGGALTRALKYSRFTGKAGQMWCAGAFGHECLCLLLVGLGKADRWTKSLETLGAQIVGRLYTAGETAANFESMSPNMQGQKAELAAHHWPLAPN